MNIEWAGIICLMDTPGPSPQTIHPPSLGRIFLSFLKFGATAFGGPAMISYLRDLAVERKKWIDNDTFTRGLALCQMLPGPVVVNTASYVGLMVRGAPGMLASFSGFILPSFLMLLSFSIIYSQTRSLPAAVSLFTGLQLAVIALIIHAAVSLGKSMLKGYTDALIVAAAALLLLMKVNLFLVLIGAALAGIVAYPPRTAAGPAATVNASNWTKICLLITGCFVAAMVCLWALDTRLFDLAAVMSKIVLFSFGGGYGALPLMFHEVVESRAWLDSRTFMDGVALGQITPGPILISATFVGYLTTGIVGALVGTLAVFSPGLLILTAALAFSEKLRSSPYYVKATRGINASFVGLLLYMAFQFGFQIQWDPLKVLFCLAALMALRRQVAVVYVVIAGALIALLAF